MDDQLDEVLSWRLVAEFWRRFPGNFFLIEAHPGGGQYDCLVLLTRSPAFASVMSVNRGGGSLHVHGGEKAYGDWRERMLGSRPERFLDEIARDAGLASPAKLPASTPQTLVFRFIAGFLAHCVGRKEQWECRNGQEDTSGYGGGRRDALFACFPDVRVSEGVDSLPEPPFGQDAYNYWFLLRDGDPLLCLRTDGVVCRTDGRRYELAKLYRPRRRIWPMICEVAGDLLP